MVFKYWKADGKALVEVGVDRIVFNSFSELSIRVWMSGGFEWKKLSFGDDYLQFTVDKD